MKIDVIRNNAHKYSVSAMCDFLELPPSTYYYHADLSGKRAKKTEDTIVSKEITRIFKESRNNYGTRKIKKELAKLSVPKHVSRRRIGRLMNELRLVSNYKEAQFKPHKSSCNEAPVKNELQGQFKQDEQLSVIVSDLTYVYVGKKWHYICLFVDLFNREIIEHSTGANKTAELVYQAIASIQANLNDVKIFHTDRGKEFDNKLISEALETFSIQQSLSMKGCPYDNAVAEATFKVFKTEFANGAHFSSLELDDYVHWFNNIRIHGTPGYLTPMEFKLQPI